MNQLLSSLLRSLPSFPDDLPAFRTGDAPEDPVDLFVDWLSQAVDAGVLAPHAMTLSTSGPDGVVTARTLILKDIDEHGWVFASRDDGVKARDLGANPFAALTFFWPQLGRQIRVTGPVRQLPQADGEADFLARPEEARAAAFVGHQSEPLGSRETYAAAYADAAARIAENPSLVARTWNTWAVAADSVEFWQASPDRAHVRLRYRLRGRAWERGLLWP
ncbi:MAG TPA: pyridoxal 5'-phosphate synthase [Mycetocola sp.]|jgi:pyridoxamine 5'-phosphate oxidase|uniref:pyridoxine/pyridoxamine 5'-phosphate oxidase n=1 Tax=Mycetocola sp. TaxID=1871042 RepID=UPI00260223B5|nr:pyridoxal 5'-phosphate synthase [Mycetocola sp.]MCU1419122.1 Pyridoxamine 5-phosphate oxidase [Mycetocola sp.]MCU1561294.1 Pyridoxamine 5-phosphate oxidase [Mycetocola sp.]HEV7849204.1 pyridoxal 5'-phosphate synthase [Mycetocola sp.]